MLAKDLISDFIPVINSLDTGRNALIKMEEFKVSHLPIVKGKLFFGLISETDIYTFNSFDEPLENHLISLKKPYVYEYWHIYDILKVVSNLKISLVPVLNNDNFYLGIINRESIIQCISELTSANLQGSLLQLKIGIRDYELSQIARIVEDSDAKILNLFMIQDDMLGFITVTIKINRSDLTNIVNSFERYGYTVNVLCENEIWVDETLQRNYESLIRYLNV